MNIHQKFNQNRWLNHADKRVHMVDDLLQKYKLIGKSNEEITQLLGAPTETKWGRRSHHFVLSWD